MFLYRNRGDAGFTGTEEQAGRCWCRPRCRPACPSAPLWGRGGGRVYWFNKPCCLLGQASDEPVFHLLFLWKGQHFKENIFVFSTISWITLSNFSCMSMSLLFGTFPIYFLDSSFMPAPLKHMALEIESSWVDNLFIFHPFLLLLFHLLSLKKQTKTIPLPVYLGTFKEAHALVPHVDLTLMPGFFPFDPQEFTVLVL